MEDSFTDLQQSYFVQYVADHGYYWDDDAKPDGVFVDKDKKAGLSPPFLIESPDTTGYYSKKILEKPALFLEFAEVEPTREGILAFANEYGMLNLAGATEVLSPVYSFPSGGPMPRRRGLGMGVYHNRYKDGRDYFSVFGEPLRYWQEEIRDMRRVVALWNWWREGDADSLSQVIRWQGNSVSYALGDLEEIRDWFSGSREKGIELGHLAFPGFQDWMLSRFRPGDCFLPAQYLLQKKINEKLKVHHTKPWLLMNEKNRLEPYLYPDSLIAALWFQFYQAVVGEKKLKRCSVCGKWEDLTDRTERQRERWTRHAKCANMLRQHRWRERRKREREGASNAAEES